jgi:hypothetical protein
MFIYYYFFFTFIYRYGKIFRAVIWWPMQEVRIYLEHKGVQRTALAVKYFDIVDLHCRYCPTQM